MKEHAHTQPLCYFIDKFHTIAKQGIIAAAKPVFNDIKDSVDNLYPYVESRNAKILKEILDEAERLDEDDGMSSARTLGLSRKEFWVLMSKFFVVLYDCDNYYGERVDFILRELLNRRDELYLDEQAMPENWYPNRKTGVTSEYFAKRNLSVKEQSLVDLVVQSDIKRMQKEEQKRTRKKTGLLSKLLGRRSNG